jgi:hypothetical protein
MSWLCPCIQFGKTQARRKDPTLANYSLVNEDVSLLSLNIFSQMYFINLQMMQCLIYCGLSCFAAYFLVQTKARDELRTEYGITQTHLEKFLKMDPGQIKAKHNVPESLVQDCLSTFFCRCCALVQEEKEVLLRGSDPKQGYQKTTGMNYP